MGAILEDNTTAVLEEEPETLEEVEEVEEQVADDQTEEEITESAEEEESEGAAEEEETEGYDISFGDESLTSEEEQEPEESEGIANLRMANREKKQRIKELEAQLQQQMAQPQQQEAPFIDEEPTLEDYEYDEEAFKKAALEYAQEKQKHENAKAEQERQVAEVNKAIQSNYEKFTKSKSEFKHPEMDDVEQEVADSLDQVDPTRKFLLLEALKDDPLAAQKVFALGKKKEVLKDLSSEQNPILFGVKLGSALNQIKATPRKRAKTAPEGKVQTNGRKDGGDSTLKKLEAEALKTGNMNKLLAYEKKLAQRKRKT